MALKLAPLHNSRIRMQPRTRIRCNVVTLCDLSPHRFTQTTNCDLILASIFRVCVLRDNPQNIIVFSGAAAQSHCGASASREIPALNPSLWQGLSCFGVAHAQQNVWLALPLSVKICADLSSTQIVEGCAFYSTNVHARADHFKTDLMPAGHLEIRLGEHISFFNGPIQVLCESLVVILRLELQKSRPAFVPLTHSDHLRYWRLPHKVTKTVAPSTPAYSQAIGKL